MTRIQSLPEAERILARLPPRAQESIEAAIPTAWLPLLPFPAILLEEIGEARARAFFRAHAAAQFDTPLYRGLLRTAQSLFGRGVDAALWIFAKGYGHAYRDAGHVEVERTGPGRATASLLEAPPIVVRDAARRVCFEAMVRGVLDATGADVELAVHDRPGRVDFELRWEP